MLYIIWETGGIASILTVPKGISYNSTFFNEFVVLYLEKNAYTQRRQKTLKKCFSSIEQST
jgi:hypothetical protein